MPKQTFAVTTVNGRRHIRLVVDDAADLDHLGGVESGENVFGIVSGAMVGALDLRPRERRIGFGRDMASTVGERLTGDAS